MGELRSVGDTEAKRRVALEHTLREAAALFKKELWDKAEEVAELQGKLRAAQRQQVTSGGSGGRGVWAECGMGSVALCFVWRCLGVLGSSHES